MSLWKSENNVSLHIINYYLFIRLLRTKKYKNYVMDVTYRVCARAVQF